MPRFTAFPYTTLFRSHSIEFVDSKEAMIIGGNLGLGPSSFARSEEHTSELQSHSELVYRLLLEKNAEEGPAKPVPAAAVLRMVRAFITITVRTHLSGGVSSLT